MDRLFPIFMLRAHWKSLSIRNDDGARQNWPVSIFIYGIPLLLCALLVFAHCRLDWTISLQAPGAILTAVVLIAGATLTAFTHLSTLRLRMTDRAKEEDDEQLDRDMVDEVAIHLSFGAMASTLTAIVIVLGMNFGRGPSGTDEIRGVFAIITAGLLVFDFLLYWIALPRLYYTYSEMNKVAPYMAGNFRGRPD